MSVREHRPPLQKMRLGGTDSHKRASTGTKARTKKMRISATTEIAGGRISTEIGKIEAASNWHAVALKNIEAELRQDALQALIRRAEDIDADAIVRVEYDIDAGTPT